MPSPNPAFPPGIQGDNPPGTDCRVRHARTHPADEVHAGAVEEEVPGIVMAHGAGEQRPHPALLQVSNGEDGILPAQECGLRGLGGGGQGPGS